MKKAAIRLHTEFSGEACDELLQNEIVAECRKSLLVAMADHCPWKGILQSRLVTERLNDLARPLANANC